MIDKYGKFGSITIDLTEGCNLNCDYCFTYSEHKPKKMNFETAKNIIIAFCKYRKEQNKDNLQIGFWGGEPLLEFDLIKKIINYCEDVLAKEYNIRFSYGGTTNGTLLTVPVAEWCRDHKLNWMISYDGIKESHDCSRCFKNGKGSHSTVLKNIKDLKAAGYMTTIRASISLKNSKYFFKNVKHLVEDLEIYDFAFSPVFEDDWTNNDFDELEKQFIEAIDYIIEKRKKDHLQIYLKHFCDEAVFYTNKKNKNSYPCGAGRSYVGVSVDGVIFPCHRFNKHGLTKEERLGLPTCIGYIENDKIIKMNEDFRNTFETFNKEPGDKCTSCSIFKESACDGNCYAIKYDITGDIKNPPDKLCKYSKLLRKVGIYYAKLAEKNNLSVSRSRIWTGESDIDVRESPCICNNACYEENTAHEITVINKNINGSCRCNQMSYNNYYLEGQYRPIKKREKDEGLLKRFLDLSKQIIETQDEEKSKEQKALEKEVLEKTIMMLSDK